MTKNALPWSNMSPPFQGGLNTLRVTSILSEPWYWVKASDGFYGVAIQLPSGTDELTSAIKGTAKIDILTLNDSNGDHYLGVVINSSELATVFYQLCLDLMAACTSSCANPNEVIAIIKRRVKSWQRLFQKGYKRLSIEQCIGLVAELQFLKDHWMHPPLSHNLSGWVGPLGAAQDFQDDHLGISVEIKCHPFDSSIVKIASKEQLDTTNDLYLVTYPCALCSSPEEGFSLNWYVEQAKNILPNAMHTTFDELLLQVGYVADASYDEMYFKIDNPKAFEVTDEFPKLTSDNLFPAILRVSYSIDLSMVTDWTCPMTDIANNLD